jgi:hypothetical protein
MRNLTANELQAVTGGLAMIRKPAEPLIVRIIVRAPSKTSLQGSKAEDQCVRPLQQPRSGPWPNCLSTILEARPLLAGLLAFRFPLSPGAAKPARG